MRKLVSILLCVAIVLLLAACGSSGTDTPASPSSTGTSISNKNDPDKSQTETETAESSEPENSSPESSTAESSGPALEDLEGHYTLSSYYNPDPYVSYLYPELRSLQDKTGEAIGSMDLYPDGTGTATYPGGSLNLTWDDSDIYLDGKALDIYHSQYLVGFDLESGESLNYSKLSVEDAYYYEVGLNPKQEELSPSDYTLGEITVERFTAEGKDEVFAVLPVTNNSNKTIALDQVNYSISSPSGEEIDYRFMSAFLTPVILPGETGFFYEQTLAENIPEDVVFEPDMVFAFEWTGDYERFDVKDITLDLQDYGDVWIHRPTGTAVIPEGTDPSKVQLNVICYGPVGRVVGHGAAVNFSRDYNPKNYFEIPENGGDAPFLVNMDGPFADKSFDQDLIDHYEFLAFTPNYFKY